MPASRASPAWDQVRPVPPAGGRSAARERALRFGGAALVAGLLWWFDLQVAAVVLVVAVTLVTVAAATWPAADRAVADAVEWARRTAGAVLSTIVMGLVHLLVFLPASLVMRLTGRDPLQLRFDEARDSYWTSRPPVPPALASRQYTREPREPAPRRSLAGRVALATGVAVLALAANYAIGAGWDALQAVSGGDRRAASPAMADSPWAGEWFREFAEVRQRWEPLLGLVTDDYRGAHINVDGLTRTSYQPAVVAPDAVAVWFFGGSTTWGTGQRDRHTIPSEVARLAEAGGTPVLVRNYGQRGWTLWQEAMLLTELLAGGEQPDIVVFYDGINEVAAQYQDPRGRPTYVQAADVAAALRNEADGPDLTDAWDAYAEHSAVHKLARALRSPARDPVPSDTELAARASDAARLHRQAVEHVTGLASGYGFEPLFLWQPAVFTKPAGEEATRARLTPPLLAIGRMYQDATAQALEPPVVDLSGVFDEISDPLFIDWAHTNEAGAALVAAAIYAELRPLLDEMAGR